MTVTLESVATRPFSGIFLAGDKDYLGKEKTLDIVDPKKVIPRLPTSWNTGFSIYSVEGEVYVSHGAAEYKVEGLSDEERFALVRRGLQVQMDRIDETIRREYADLDVRLRTRHRMYDQLSQEDERLRSITLSTMQG